MAKVFKNGYEPPPSDTDGQGGGGVDDCAGPSSSDKGGADEKGDAVPSDKGVADDKGGAVPSDRGGADEKASAGPSSSVKGGQDGDIIGRKGENLTGQLHNLTLGTENFTRKPKGPYGTPFVKFFGMAESSEDNRPSFDEMYPNVALLLLLEEIRKEISAEMPWFNWVLARLGLHLVAQSDLTDKQKSHAAVIKPKKYHLMEAQVDGYLCYRDKASRFSPTPLAICEAKPFVRSQHGERTLRQETAEMACWIAEHGHKPEGVLQASHSGKSRRLLLSQDRHEIYIVIGEYGPVYHDYITGKVSLKAMAPTPKDHSFDAEANKRAAQGSGTYNEQVKALGDSGGRVGRTPVPKIPTAVNLGSRKRAGKDAAGKEATGKGAVTAPEPRKHATRSQSRPAQQLPSADEFLVMHQFGPFLTGNAEHMGLFVRRLIGLMLQLKESAPGAGQPPPEAVALGSPIPVSNPAE